jgi:hypothetical protein
MTALKRIVTAAYETTDGKTFADKGEAAKHQAHLKRIADVDALVVAQLPHSPDSMRYLDAVTVAQIAQFIVESADDLREILPKRAKAAPAAVPVAPTAGLPGDAVPALSVIGAVGDPQVPGAPVGSPLGATASIALPTASQPDAVAGFNFPVGLVGNVANQQALANA